MSHTVASMLLLIVSLLYIKRLPCFGLPMLCLLQKLEQLLPARPAAVEVSEDAEEVDLMEYDPSQHTDGRGRRGEAYQDGDSDDEGAGGGPRVQCAQQ